MKYKYPLFIGIIVLLSLLYTWYEANKPQEINWKETYSPYDKIPYGTYIAWQSLSQIFLQAKYEQTPLSLYEQLEGFGADTGNVYMVVDWKFNPDETEIPRLLEWVAEGNYLFVAAREISDTLLSFFSLETEIRWEKVRVHLDLAGIPSGEYNFSADYGNYFMRREGFEGTILGYRQDREQADFVSISYGKGDVYFNLNPRAFTNYYVLDSLNGDYYYKALSCLPVNVRSVVWDVHNFMGSGTGSPLEVILHYPALRLALYLLLAGALLYVFFKVKREQRPVPVILPPQNRMLEFVATISGLYFRQKDHYAIAVKEIGFFLEEVRFRYKLRTDELDEDFIRLLAGRAGVDAEETARLVSLIREITEKKQVDESCLKALVKGIECFIK